MQLKITFISSFVTRGQGRSSVERTGKNGRSLTFKSGKTRRPLPLLATVGRMLVAGVGNRGSGAAAAAAAPF
jgi:hypothetical protein